MSNADPRFVDMPASTAEPVTTAQPVEPVTTAQPVEPVTTAQPVEPVSPPVGVGTPQPIAAVQHTALAPVPKKSAASKTNTPSHQLLVLLEGAAVTAIGGAATGALAGIGSLTGDKLMSGDAWYAFAAAVGVSALHSLAAWVVTKTTNK